MLRYLILLLVVSLTLCACARSKVREQAPVQESVSLKLTSVSFEDEGMIPSRHTCDGADVSPPLAWDGIPEGTVALALICDDPDAPMGTWAHWVLYDLPPSVRDLSEGVPAQETLANGGKQGRNSSGKIGYSGPCPPSGTHRYYFKLYALDTQVGLPPGTTKEQLLDAMEGHILAQGELMGRYTRS